MDDRRYQRHDFNHGRSAIVLAYLQVNQAWTVFREDGEIAGNQRVHNDYADALEDYRNRVGFVIEMGAS